MTKASRLSFRPGPLAVTIAIAIAVVTIGACERERRQLHPSAAASALSGGVVLSALAAGPPPAGVQKELTEAVGNAYAMSEGKRLFEAYNCVGCHAHGGGAIGPALMDDNWIYGSAPANVFATIVEGRPNGMPSFRGRIPDFQVAELVAYVRSMGGLTGQTWSPGRNDAMHVKKPENASDSQRTVREEGRSPP